MELSELNSKILYIDDDMYKSIYKDEMSFDMYKSKILKTICLYNKYYNLSNIDINIYEKTLMFYIVKYLEDPIINYKYEDWQNFCLFYGMQFSFIEKLVNISPNLNFRFLIFDREIIDIHMQSYELTIIDDMFRYMFISEDLKKIKIDKLKKYIEKNTYIYKDIADLISILNTSVATRESIKKGYFDKKLIPQTYSIDDICSISRILYLIEKFTYNEDKCMLENLYNSYNYEIKKYIDMIFLILTLQILKQSPFTIHTLKNSIQKLIYIFMDLFKDAKIISIFKNERYFDISKKYFDRSSKDQTTRLQIFYEYYNQDQYSLRLDCSHIGVSHFHINNTSKGGVEYFPLDIDKYNSFIKKNPQYEKWFIKYGYSELYFLREKYKREVYGVQHKELKNLLELNQHFTIPEFKNEKNMINIFESWLKFFTTIGEDMPNEKIDPKKLYIKSFLSEFTNEYYLHKKNDKYFNENDFKIKIFKIFSKIESMDIIEIESFFNGYTINEIIEYSYEKLNDI